MDEVSAAAGAEHGELTAAHAVVAKLQSEARVAAQGIAAAEAETEALRGQLQETAAGRLRATTALQARLAFQPPCLYALHCDTCDTVRGRYNAFDGRLGPSKALSAILPVPCANACWVY